jgi:hypothetical protein
MEMNFEIRILKLLMNLLMMIWMEITLDSNQEDEIHRLIQDTFAPMDEDNQDDSHDVDPLLEKSRQPLYEGSTINILSAILLLVNLKVLNGLSNTCLTQILRYLIC